MNIAILGYGKEGKSVESYFKKKGENVEIFDDFTDEELKNLNLSSFDLIFRSPSVKPLNPNWNSVTKYFFDNCICPIIGVTGTKGKGTTCSLIAAILQNLKKTVHLVGNIGNPAIDILDQIQPDDIVVYELSSFQLWDLTASPKISVILRIEPDHLNIHKNFDDYVNAKSHITKFQKATDYCIYFKDNRDSVKIAEQSPAQKLPYPIIEKNRQLDDLLNSLNIPGAHNRENAEAALLAVSSYCNLPLEEFISKNFENLKSTFKTFHGLPHRLEFIRELNNIKYYDDNFATNIASTKVAIEAFPEQNLITIIGGRDKTNNADLPELSTILKSPQIKKVVLIGESGHKLFTDFHQDNFILTESLEDAVKLAKSEAEKFNQAIVLMSPAAASFDMFENVYDRGAQYQNLIKNL